ncbi:hypothetical protein [Pedobacter rhodius]|uniref:Uncharacterized protein n=1 Tax=Pedobacter rhodius TaxID=3004098 RepID=A0ABT4KUW6_9SPHI|nr:hypothetical protein [Pedobacter sp. SJ11]MCZ4222708.1 hypothetical protein [Pedobacter sp. SJ11]
MESIDLQTDLKLSFEKLPHNVRLIVLKNDKEWVCKKEKLGRLFYFAEADEEHLFNGRLQLFKNEHKINIQVKNEFIGTISNETFKQVLSKLK